MGAAAARPAACYTLVTPRAASPSVSLVARPGDGAPGPGAIIELPREETGMRQLVGTLILGFAASAVAGGADDVGKGFKGEWRTTLGVVTFEPVGDKVTARFVGPGMPPVQGTVKGKELTLEYREGRIKGNATLTLDDSGRSFTGWFQYSGGGQNAWNGWRPDPEAPAGKTGSFGGLWLTDLGLMELEQTGEKVRGRYAIRGTSDIEGDVKGRRLEFRYKGFRGGKGWFDLSKDGSTLSGAAVGDGANVWYGWGGRSAPEFARHAKLVPGKLVDGSTRGLLTYTVRAPEGYKEGGKAKWPVVVLLHGSNMNGKSYVATLAAAWPEVAKECILIGINGETPSNTSDDPRFNYSYVNFVGRSTYKGFPGTDRESPALVSEALAELKDVYPVRHYFVGGHSQGGFLTYSLLMNYPESIAGAFPISCGLIFQCEPSAYDDAPLRKAQRAVPLAIVHGKTDPIVDFGMGWYAATLFGESGWPAFRFFADDSGQHMFARLPVGDAIQWLLALSSDDPARLLDFAEARLKQRAYRDAIAALDRAKSLGLKGDQAARHARLARQVDTPARAGAKDLLPKIKANRDNTWIDAFLDYRDQFEFAPGAREGMRAFEDLRAKHEPPAKEALNQARQSFQQGQRDAGYAKYQEIVDRDYASSLYRPVKRWLSERK
jgi:predicted esterase